MIRSLLVATLVPLTLVVAPTPADAATHHKSPTVRCEVAARGVPFKSKPKTYRTSPVWLYGDSITFQTKKHLRATSKKRIAIDAWWGRDTQSAIDALKNDIKQNRRNLPETVVMAVGTNDLSNLPTFRSKVKKVRKMLPRSTRIIWVNVYVKNGAPYRKANDVLRTARGIKAISWVKQNKGRSLLPDTVHVNNRGCELRNKLINRYL